MDTVIFALNAVLPIMALIALGYILKRVGFLTENFVGIGNKLCFRVFLPAMLFLNIYKVKSLNELELKPALFAVCGILAAAAIGVVAAQIFLKDDKQRAVVAQCVFRSNYAIIGVPLAGMLFGARGELVASLLSAFTIPVFNILAVVVLTAYGSEGVNKRETLKKTLVGIAKNPLIHGVLLGVICVAIRQAFSLPALLDGSITGSSAIQKSENPLYFIFIAVDYLSKATTPMALIVLGAQFEFVSFKKYLKPVLIGTSLRTVLVPAIALTAACLMGFDGASIAAFVAVFASPVAVASAIMAREMNADGDLAATLVVSTTAVSAVTLIIIVMILKASAFI